MEQSHVGEDKPQQHPAHNAELQVKELSFDGRHERRGKSLEEKSKRRKCLDTVPRG